MAESSLATPGLRAFFDFAFAPSGRFLKHALTDLLSAIFITCNFLKNERRPEGESLIAPGYHAGNYPITARMFVLAAKWLISPLLQATGLTSLSDAKKIA